MDDIITLDYGSGGIRSAELIENTILPAFSNPALEALGDGAILEGSHKKLVFSTDSFVVTPWKFPGGDIGKLAICGTVNDICMAGGIPKYLSLSLILEEGFPKKDLETILLSAKKAAAAAHISVVTGDTKVVERGKGDGIYLNTAGIGCLRLPGLSPKAIQEGDSVLISGSIGQHGAAVLMARGELPGTGNLLSDCTPLNHLFEKVADAGEGEIRIMRDPTRGGVATVLNEFVEHLPYGIQLEEASLPISPEVSAACELLGLDPLYSACEGRMVLIVSPEGEEKVLKAMQTVPEGAGAAKIGTVKKNHPGSVILHTFLGGSRILGKLTGAQLPRIC